jgi:hypothetical protein
VSRLNLLHTLRQSIPFLAREKGSLPRGQMLALKPTRSREVAWEMKLEDEVPGAKLTVPRRDDRIGQLLSRVFHVPTTKTIELDEFGAQVWSRCDGAHSVEQLVNFTCDTYKLNRRQAEVSVITFMRMLAQRRLIGLKAVGPQPRVNSSSSINGNGKGTAHVRSGERQRPQTKRRRRH